MTVMVASDPEQKIYVLKCRTDGGQGMYHEIKLLLTLSPHPNITPFPPYLVTSHYENYDGNLLCGFLLEYQAGGSLKDNLPCKDFTFTERLG